MGPIALFDKSFLQSLSIDESMWFDHFFLAVVSPFFYVETLADLEKPEIKNRTPEQEVRVIADKFPDMHSAPCAFHGSLALGSLLGNEVPMSGQIPMAGGRPVKGGDRSAVVWDESPEAQAFSRWQAGSFLELERQFAREWRHSLSAVPGDAISRSLAALRIGGESSKTLEDAKGVANLALADTQKAPALIEFALLLLDASGSERGLVLSRWIEAGSPPLPAYAPYASFVLTVEIFFQVALSAGLISSARPSNRVDIAYLFYLPFCMVFVSSDRLHRRCVPLFLRAEQDFVWGPDLKTDLAKLDAHFSQLPRETKEEGVMSFAKTPPTEGDYLVASLWDKHLRPWRSGQLEPPVMAPEAEARLRKELDKITDALELPENEIDFDLRSPEAIALQRRVRKRKGSWWQLPKDLKSEQGRQE
jgi:hypothetical protein